MKDHLTSMTQENEIKGEEQLIKFHENIAEGLGLVKNYFLACLKDMSENGTKGDLEDLFKSYVKGLEIVQKFHLVEKEYIETLVDEKVIANEKIDD